MSRLLSFLLFNAILNLLYHACRSSTPGIQLFLARQHVVEASFLWEDRTYVAEETRSRKLQYYKDVCQPLMDITWIFRAV